MLFFYLQVERDGDQHPAGGHDAVAGPEQWPPACVLDEQTLVDVVEGRVKHPNQVHQMYSYISLLFSFTLFKLNEWD